MYSFFVMIYAGIMNDDKIIPYTNSLFKLTITASNSMIPKI